MIVKVVVCEKITHNFAYFYLNNLAKFNSSGEEEAIKAKKLITARVMTPEFISLNRFWNNLTII